MDIEELKNTWRSSTSKISAAESANTRRVSAEVVRGRFTSKANLLRRRFTISAFAGACMAPLSWLILSDIGLPVWLCASIAAYFLLMAAMLVRTLLRMTPAVVAYDGPIRETLEGIASVRRSIMQQQSVGIPLATLLIALILESLIGHEAETGMIAAVAVGVVTGAVLGLMIYRHTRRTLSYLERALRETESDQNSSPSSANGSEE